MIVFTTLNNVWDVAICMSRAELTAASVAPAAALGTMLPTMPEYRPR